MYKIKAKCSVFTVVKQSVCKEKLLDTEYSSMVHFTSARAQIS